MPADFDLAIAGSGFAGSLLAMIARRLGRSVILLERERHPRFVIGESSTPLANQFWQEITSHYDLDRLKPFAKWGSWQRQFPQIPVGLKRGFTFYHHGPGRTFGLDPDRRKQLLVAASSRDEVADTHWYRPAFDHFLVGEAQRIGAEFIDEVHLNEVRFEGDVVLVDGQRCGRPFHCRARFLIDATGPRGFLFRTLALGAQSWNHLPATAGLYSHFQGVRRWDELHPSEEAPPYPVDDAAVHHLFPGGWMWVLRFNQGITSAGVAVTQSLALELELENTESAWNRVLDRLPSVREQFVDSQRVEPFVQARSLSFRCDRVAGPRWALLPHAVGFVDPLLSTGIALSLAGIQRVARLLEEDWGRPRLDDHLKEYARLTDLDLSRTELLIAALYSNLGNFPMFRDLSLLYFAGVGYAEIARRLGRSGLAGEQFLLGDHHTFGPGLEACCREALRLGANPAPADAEVARLRRMIQETIAPVDLTGLRRTDRRHWYPVDPDDLLESASKLDFSPGEAQAAVAGWSERSGK